MTLASNTAMIMAAGLGTRMRPLTDAMPKPLVPVAGQPLIDHALDRLAEAGVARAVVNLHYRADQLARYLAGRDYPAIALSDETALLLETGGGMAKALADGLLPDPFFALNSDNIWTDGPSTVFEALSAAWLPADMDALLLLVPHGRAYNYQGQGDFSLNNTGQIIRRNSAAKAPLIYTGIQLVSHRLMRDCPEGPFSTNVLWNRAIGEGRLYGIIHKGEWFEVGEPGAIGPTEAALGYA